MTVKNNKMNTSLNTPLREFKAPEDRKSMYDLDSVISRLSAIKSNVHWDETAEVILCLANEIRELKKELEDIKSRKP